MQFKALSIKQIERMSTDQRNAYYSKLLSIREDLRGKIQKLEEDQKELRAELQRRGR